MRHSRILIGLALVAVTQSIALAQTYPGSELQPQVAPALAWMPLPESGKRIERDSGLRSGLETGAITYLKEELSVPDWRWIRVYFTDCALGERSFIRITSTLDGDEQILDARNMPYWRGASAFFNGDTVVVEFVVDPADHDVFVHLAGVAGGFDPPAPVMSRTLCGADDRVVSFDSRVSRIAKDTGDPNEPLAWCTAWQVSNGALLTAGHCVDDNVDGNVDTDFLTGVIQFNVPLSDCDGAPNHPPAADQYPIDAVTAFSWFGTGMSVGRDWAVMSALPNGGASPHIARGWFRMTNELPQVGANVRVTGFGTDSTPMGCSGDPMFPANEQNQTNQTAYGPFVSEITEANAITLEYEADTTGGNSGSPIIWDGQNITFGIHTNGGCAEDSGSNAGTSFELDALENAIGNFPGANSRYVDGAFPMAVTRDGTIFRPWSTFSSGVSGVPAGGVLTVVAGYYSTPLPLTITKAMTVRAPVGLVTIGD